MVLAKSDEDNIWQKLCDAKGWFMFIWCCQLPQDLDFHTPEVCLAVSQAARPASLSSPPLPPSRRLCVYHLNGTPKCNSWNEEP